MIERCEKLRMTNKFEQKMMWGITMIWGSLLLIGLFTSVLTLIRLSSLENKLHQMNIMMKDIGNHLQ